MNVERNDDANTAAALTRATPIISAAADADVRRGARPAFSRARTPGVLNSLADRPADQLGDRAGDRRRHAGDPEEDQQGADAGEHERADRAAGAHEQPDEEADDAEAR